MAIASATRALGLAIAVLLLAVLGALLVIAVRMPGTSWTGPLPPLTDVERALAERLERHVRTLAGTIGERNLWRYDALEEAARYVTAELEGAGYAVDRQIFSSRDRPVRNLVVEVAGGARAAEVLVVGAHYDSVRGSPGANDNATGVAALVEIARLARDMRPARTLRFVAFVNEEPPFSYTDEMGSLVNARAAAGRGDRVAGMIALETIGYYDDAPGSQRYPFPMGLFYPDTGNFIGFVANTRSAPLVKRAVSSFRRHARFPSEGTAAPGWIQGIGWSDHWSFWKQGWPALMVTDTALFRYAEYHTPADRPDIVDYERLARVTAGLAAVVGDLASPGPQ